MVLTIVACWLAVHAFLGQRSARFKIHMHRELTDNSCFSTDVLSIQVRRMEGHKMVCPRFTFLSNGGLNTINADSAWIEDVENDGKIVVVHCHDPKVDLGTCTFSNEGACEFRLPTRD